MLMASTRAGVTRLFAAGLDRACPDKEQIEEIAPVERQLGHLP